MNHSRLTIFAGHYGSGKTTLAVNYALRLRETQPRVVVCDLDIVNPYFRTADYAELFAGRGIELIAPQYANSNVDIPAIPSGAQAMFDDRSICAVIDLGGDDRGALALGRYARRVLAENDYQMLLVANKYRPLTRGVRELTDIKNEIETAAGVSFTGLVNNSNLGSATTADDIAGSFLFMDEVSRETGLELVMTAARRGLPRLPPEKAFFPIDIYEKTLWKI